MGKKNGARRVAVVAGLRTPFARSGSAYKDLTALDLGKLVVAELMQRAELDPKEVQQVVYGQVVPSLSAPNIAREIVLGTGMPRDIEAFSVSRACATSYQSTVNVAEAILAGTIDCGVAGGADSASDVPIAVSKKLAEALVAASRARSIGERSSPSLGSRPETWFRCRLRSRSRAPGSRWERAPRRWRRRTASAVVPRTSWRIAATLWLPPPGPTGASRRK